MFSFIKNAFTALAENINNNNNGSLKFCGIKNNIWWYFCSLYDFMTVLNVRV